MSIMLARWAKLSNLTDPEKALEPAVAALGTPYRVQYPFWSIAVFADFALVQHRVIFEVDGPEHRTKAGKAKDAERTAKLARFGWRVARCTNDEATRDPRGAVKKMLAELDLGHLLKE